MAGPEPARLLHERHLAVRQEVLHALGLISNDDRDMALGERLRKVHCEEHHRPPAHRMEHLGQLGPHADAMTRSEDDGGEPAHLFLPVPAPTASGTRGVYITPENIICMASSTLMVTGINSLSGIKIKLQEVGFVLVSTYTMISRSELLT